MKWIPSTTSYNGRAGFGTEQSSVSPILVLSTSVMHDVVGLKHLVCIIYDKVFQSATGRESACAELSQLRRNGHSGETIPAVEAEIRDGGDGLGENLCVREVQRRDAAASQGDIRGIAHGGGVLVGDGNGHPVGDCTCIGHCLQRGAAIESPCAQGGYALGQDQPCDLIAAGKGRGRNALHLVGNGERARGFGAAPQESFLVFGVYGAFIILGIAIICVLLGYGDLRQVGTLGKRGGTDLGHGGGQGGFLETM